MGCPMTKKPAPKPAADWQIDKATKKDWPAIWNIFRSIISTGDTFAYAPDTTEEDAYEIWMGSAAHGTPANTYVVRDGGEIVGTYSLRANHYGLGSHVSNAGYMVHPKHRGRGIAKAMCLHSFAEAKRQRFISMQFNYVVSTNVAAVELWQKMGFKIIGTAPKSYRHAKHGFVDVYIMHRFLDGVGA